LSWIGADELSGFESRHERERVLSLNLAKIGGRNVEFVHCGRDRFDRPKWTVRPEQNVILGDYIEQGEHACGIHRNAGNIVVQLF
jgi:hypothetical protein